MREKYERKNISLENQHWKPNYLLQDLYHVSATIPGSSAKVNVYKCFFKWIWTSAQEAWGWCIQKSRSQISITESEWNHKASLHWFLTCFFRFAFIFHNSRHSFLNVPFQKVSTEILCCFYLPKHMALLPKHLFGVGLFQLFIIRVIPGVQIYMLTTRLIFWISM